MFEDGDKSTPVKRLIFKRASNFLPTTIKTPFDNSTSGLSPQDDHPAEQVGSPCLLSYPFTLYMRLLTCA